MRQLLAALLMIVVSAPAFAQSDCAAYQVRIDEMMASGNYDRNSMLRAEAAKQQIAAVCQMGGTQMADMVMAQFEAEFQGGSAFKEEIAYISTDELTDEYLLGDWCSGTPGEGEVIYLRFRDDGSYRIGVTGFQGGPELREHMDTPGEVWGDTHGDWTGPNREAFIERFEIAKLASMDDDSFVAVTELDPTMEFNRGTCWE